VLLPLVCVGWAISASRADRPRKPRTGKVQGWINAQRKIGPYLLVVLADFELVVALALALGWLNSLAPCWGVRLQSPQ